MSEQTKKIKKIHIKKKKTGDQINISYEVYEKGDVKTVVFSSEDEPLHSFTQALEDLTDCIAKIFQFSPKYAESLEARGISLSYQGADERMGAVFSAVMTRETSSRPFNLHTPLLLEPSEDGDDDGPVLSPACLKRIDDLVSEAYDYLDGKRAPKPEQLKLVS